MVLAVLLERVSNGDREAFDELYLATVDKMRRVCDGVCADQRSVPDVVQDAYLLIWRNAAKYNPVKGSVITWMAVIVRNRTIDHNRQRAGMRSVTVDEIAELPDPTPSAETLILKDDELRMMRASLARLPDRQRKVIHAAFYGRTPYTRLASDLGIPEGTVKSWIRRGLATMRAQMVVG